MRNKIHIIIINIIIILAALLGCPVDGSSQQSSVSSDVSSDNSSSISASSSSVPQIPTVTAESCSFTDEDFSENQISGTLNIIAASNETSIESYNVYWGASADQKISSSPLITEITADGNDKTYIFTESTGIPADATHIIIFSDNTSGESEVSVSTIINDKYIKMVSDINTSGGSIPENLTISNNNLYFTAESNVYGRELFMTNSLTTEIIRNIGPDDSDAYISNLIDFNDTLFFHAYDNSSFDLWQTTGESAFVLINDNYNYFTPENFFVMGNNLYFSAQDSTNDKELWVYNGSDSHEFIDINSLGSSNPGNFCLLDGIYFVFSANDLDHGNELWISDGNDTGTEILKDIINGNLSSNPRNMIKCVNDVIFIADSLSYGEELWITDGTVSGTEMIMDIKTGTLSSNPENLTLFNSFIYFSADDGNNGTELWRTNGASTELVSDINKSDSSFPYGFCEYNNILYFSANDGENGYELWTTQGTDITTQMLIDIDSSADSAPSDFCVFNGSLYFSAFTNDNGRELWVHNSEGTRLVYDINPGSDSSDVSKLIVYDDKLYFTADDGINGTELWVYNALE